MLFCIYVCHDILNQSLVSLDDETELQDVKRQEAELMEVAVKINDDADVAGELEEMSDAKMVLAR